MCTIPWNLNFLINTIIGFLYIASFSLGVWLAGSRKK
jgi:hypothetical protein